MLKNKMNIDLKKVQRQSPEMDTLSTALTTMPTQRMPTARERILKEIPHCETLFEMVKQNYRNQIKSPLKQLMMPPKTARNIVCDQKNQVLKPKVKKKATKKALVSRTSSEPVRSKKPVIKTRQ